MIKNIGSTDKIVRIVMAVLLLILILTGAISGLLAIVFSLIIGVFLVTSILGSCPLYMPCKVSTLKK